MFDSYTVRTKCTSDIQLGMLDLATRSTCYRERVGDEKCVNNECIKIEKMVSIFIVNSLKTCYLKNYTKIELQILSNLVPGYFGPINRRNLSTENFQALL